MNTERYELSESQRIEFKRLATMLNKRLKDMADKGFSLSICFDSEQEFKNHLLALYALYVELEMYESYQDLFKEENHND